MKNTKLPPQKCCATLNSRSKIRYEKLMEAASEVFLEYGFEKANMNDIVKRSGGSLATIYKLFGSKEALFAEMLLRRTENIFSNIDYKNISYEGKFENFLYDIGKHFLDMLHDENAYIFHRVIIHEGHKNNAKLGKIFFKNAVSRTSSAIMEYFKNEKTKGNIDIEDPELAAYQFLHMVKEPFFTAKVLGLDTEIPLFDPEKSLRQTVKIFTHGILKQK